MKNDSPMLTFDNRCRLIREHIEEADPDIVGLSEVDSVSGENGNDYVKLVTMMKNLGYLHQYFEKSNTLSAVAIFYKENKFDC